MKKFIDIGANLTDSMFQGHYRGNVKHIPDLENVILRGKKCGVGSIMLTVGSVHDIKKSFDIIDEFKDVVNIKCTLGIHPTRGNEFSKYPHLLNTLRKQFTENRDKIIAYGEFGLDIDRLHFCDLEQQVKSFQMQLDLVKEFGLPMFLHCRGATDLFCEILESNRSKWEAVGGVVHSFTGTVDELEKILSLGLSVSINGCSMKTEEQVEMITQIPLDKLMLETDCPWCKIRNTHASARYVKGRLPKEVDPEKYNPESGLHVKSRNELDHMPLIAEVVWNARQEKGVVDENIKSLDEMVELIYNNTVRMYNQLEF